jgi:hypothetical protein
MCIRNISPPHLSGRIVEVDQGSRIDRKSRLLLEFPGDTFTGRLRDPRHSLRNLPGSRSAEVLDEEQSVPVHDDGFPAQYCVVQHPIVTGLTSVDGRFVYQFDLRTAVRAIL